MTAGLICLILVFVALTLLRLPLALVMLAAGAVYFKYTGQDVGLLAGQVMGQMTSFYVLVAIPMFILAANAMNATGISERLWSAADALVGRLRGGTGHVTVLVSIVFSSMSGSAVTDAAGPGMVAIRMMRQIGRFPGELAVAITAASAVIAPVIPPSIPLVIYAMLSGTSVAKLFLAGIVPGLLMGLAVSLTIVSVARKHGLPAGQAVPLSEVFPRLKRAGIPLTLPIVLLGGIWSGIFSPTEAAAVAALWAYFLGIVVLRSLRMGQLYETFTESLRQTATTMLLIGSAFVVNYVIANEGVAAALTAYIDALDVTPLQFMLLVNLLLLLLGCLLDGSVLLLVVVPLLLPSARLYGIDLTHFGIVVVVNFMIGMITPPYGLLLFVLSGLAGVPLQSIFRAVVPFIAVLVVLLGVLVYFPQVALFLPQMFGFE